MNEHPALLAQRLSLVDAVDTLLHKGVVLSGEALLSVAGVDLVYVGLNLLVASVESLRKAEGGGVTDAAPEKLSHHPSSLMAHPSELPPSFPSLYAAPQVRGTSSVPPNQALATPPVPSPVAALDTGGDRPEQGLARLVLTLIELLRQVLERQALRRADGGGLTDDEVERMGVALMQLEAKMAELRDAFGLAPEDLSIDLGPLGRLL